MIHEVIKKTARRIFKPKLLLVLGLLSLAPGSAKAFIGVSPGDIFIQIIKFGAYLVNYLAGMVFATAGFLVKLAFDFNERLMGPENTIVHVGWQVTRDIANFGFVVVMIGIAFCFIIGYSKYGTWSLLKDLVIAAITINFSFAIVGVVVEFSDSITRYFLNAIEPSTATITPSVDIAGKTILPSFTLGDRVALKLADAFGPQRFFISDDNPLPFNPEEQAGGLVSFGTAALNSIAGIVFAIAFTIIGALTLFGLAIMLFMRFVWLTILIITAPLAWLAGLVPELKSHNDKWWKDLFKWAFFAPQVTFFIYLAFLFVNALGKAEFIPATAGNYVATAISTILIQGIQMVIICGILFFGLRTAEGTGIEGGKFAINRARWVGKKSQDYLKERAKRTGAFAARNTLGRVPGLADWLERRGTNARWYNPLHFAAKFSGANMLARNLGKGMRTANEWTNAQVKDAHGKVDKLPIEQQLRMMRNGYGAQDLAVLENAGKKYNELQTTRSQKKKEVKTKIGAVTKAKTAEKDAQEKYDAALDKSTQDPNNKELKVKLTKATRELETAKERIKDSKEELDQAITEEQEAREEMAKFSVMMSKNAPRRVASYNPVTKNVTGAFQNAIDNDVDASGKPKDKKTYEKFQLKRMKMGMGANAENYGIK